MRAALYSFVVFAQDGDWDGHMDLGEGWGIVMMIGMLVFLGAIAVAVVWTVRTYAVDRRPPEDGGRETPLEILDRSLAEGRISVEEYEQRRRVLMGSPPDAPAE